MEIEKEKRKIEFVPVPAVELVKSAELSETARGAGGYGSTVTIAAAARESGVTTYEALWHRVKKLGLKPVEGNKYRRSEIMPVAAMRIGKGNGIAVSPSPPGLATIHEVAREAGIGAATLRHRLKASGIGPVERRQVHGDLYRRDEIMPVARKPLQRGRPKGGYKLPPRVQDHMGEKCPRCGKLDYGNECRGGLCLDCFCHDFCKERGI